MWATIASFVLKIVSGPLVDAYREKLKAGTAHETLASSLALRELEVQQKEIELQNRLKIAQIGHPWEIEKLFAYVTLLFYGKCLIWDKMLEWGSTDPLKGDISVWAGLIVSFYFGKRTVETAIRLWKY